MAAFDVVTTIISLVIAAATLWVTWRTRISRMRHRYTGRHAKP
jgi:hypothetical protein